MGELAIRRNRSFAAIQRQEAGKAEKPSGAARSQSAAKAAGHTLSETLQKLLSSAGRAETQIRESRRTLQTGEAVLAEVQDRLSRAMELAEESASGGAPDRKALQAELERLLEEIDRMLGGASVGDTRLFLDADTDEADALLHAVMSALSGGQSGLQALPDWLARGISQSTFDLEQVLAALGLDRAAGGAEILAALAGRDLDSDPAAGYLAALYLGAVIAGGTPSGPVDLEEAMTGLRQLLAKMAEGMSPDEAVDLLTDGAFTSLSDFQSQFLDGTAPGLESFLAGLPVSEDSASLLEEILALPLLAGGGEMDLVLLMDLLMSIGIGEGETVSAGGSGSAEEANISEAAAAPELSEAAPAAAEAAPGTSGPSDTILRFGDLRVAGEDLSGVSFGEASGELTVSGTADITVQGGGEEGQPVLVTGSGTVTLQDAKVSTLTITSPEARVFSAGTSELGEVQLRTGVSLTFGGSGLFRINTLHTDASNALRLTGGAVVMERADEAAPLAVPVVLDAPASLAAEAAVVSGSGGKPLDAYDVIWKALLPGWSALTAVEINGRQAKMELDPSLPARLWLERGDPSHGHPIHTLVFRGRDAFGQERIRYSYLRWSQQMETFEETVMYPNPFTVTGGEAGRDWIYEEETQTLRILTSQVTAVSGGAGMDANQSPFSGRIALADGIGKVELTLEGVACQVSSGRAFSLGRENDVALLLESGTGSRFESGAGCAGISLGDGTSLRIDRGPRHSGKTAGTLTASGGAGGAGIGRDSGGGRDRNSHIRIMGGEITAAGNGGGAGIGGGLGTPVGDISIHGGKITAEAAFHAAAIGAGVRGACGDILIDGTARIMKAQGGDPGADIGACLFGSCGKVLISGAADIGRAQLRTRAGVSLHTGEDALTLPQFRLSSKTLRLDRLSVATREAAKAAKEIVEADRRWVAQIQDAYSALYTRLEQNAGGLSSVRQYVDMAKGLVRDTAAAGVLLKDTRQSISQTMHTYSGRRRREDVRQLLR